MSATDLALAAAAAVTGDVEVGTSERVVMACDDGAPPSKSQPQPKPLLNPEPVTPTPTLAPIPRSHPYPYPYPYPYPVPVPELVPLPLPLPLPLPVRLTLPPPTTTTPTLNRTRPPTPTPAPNQATPTRGRCARSGGTSTGPRPSGSWRGRPKGSDPCQNARGYLGIHGLFSSHAILVRTYSPCPRRGCTEVASSKLQKRAA